MQTINTNIFYAKGLMPAKADSAFANYRRKRKVGRRNGENGNSGQGIGRGRIFGCNARKERASAKQGKNKEAKINTLFYCFAPHSFYIVTKEQLGA